MSSAFEDMNMEVCMEENPFEEAGLPAGDPGKVENGLPDGFMDSMDAFGENPFDSDGQEPDAASLPAQEETVSDGAWEDAEESAGPESDGAEETGEPEEAGEPANAGEPEKEESFDAEEETEDKKRAEHEAAEARRKAEWEAKQQAKKDAEKAQMERIMAMSEEELIPAADLLQFQILAGKDLEFKEEKPCGRRTTEKVKQKSYRTDLQRIWRLQ